MSDNMTGEQRLRAAFERLKINTPTIVPKGSKINPKNVEAEAGMGDGAVYYYKDLVAEIKAAKEAQIAERRAGGEKTATDKTKQLREERDQIKAQRDAALKAQAELAYNLFQACDDPRFIVNANRH
ncbi:hypothetical protein BM525_20505 (plasmid) [Alteromonas mediterranea]|uniref:Uncharacterized protein n=1 Tax=Alteromonas mediterranea TaxID=314275 RepID=A0AAC9JF75_9ALTE|nr:hypothetical protein [Alteromonas mediterranea]APD92256.1 hypothetical protein BM524_20310 [Alteromonas mediterranea]APE00111.1 hypothetical protein BM525_20505 [Alteromonas mediterranea]